MFEVNLFRCYKERSNACSWFILFFSGIWNLCLERNGNVFNNKTTPKDTIISRIYSHAKDICDVFSVNLLSPNLKEKEFIKWCPSDVGY